MLETDMYFLREAKEMLENNSKDMALRERLKKGRQKKKPLETSVQGGTYADTPDYK